MSAVAEHGLRSLLGR